MRFFLFSVLLFFSTKAWADTKWLGSDKVSGYGRWDDEEAWSNGIPNENTNAIIDLTKFNDYNQVIINSGTTNNQARDLEIKLKEGTFILQPSSLQTDSFLVYGENSQRSDYKFSIAITKLVSKHEFIIKNCILTNNSSLYFTGTIKIENASYLQKAKYSESKLPMSRNRASSARASL
jgi:hypothetical protein